MVRVDELSSKVPPPDSKISSSYPLMLETSGSIWDAPSAIPPPYGYVCEAWVSDAWMPAIVGAADTRLRAGVVGARLGRRAEVLMASVEYSVSGSQMGKRSRDDAGDGLSAIFIDYGDDEKEKDISSSSPNGIEAADTADARRLAPATASASAFAASVFRVHVLCAPALFRAAATASLIGSAPTAEDASALRIAGSEVARLWRDARHDIHTLVPATQLRPLSPAMAIALLERMSGGGGGAGAGAEAGAGAGAGVVAEAGARASAASRPALVADKWWNRRYALWRLYDGSSVSATCTTFTSTCTCGNPGPPGIRMDAPEAWYSVTPEAAATVMAGVARAGSGTIAIDLFCGAGGNTLALARAGATVIAVDISAERLADARHNVCCVYGAGAGVVWVCGDALALLAGLVGGAVKGERGGEGEGAKAKAATIGALCALGSKTVDVPTVLRTLLELAAAESLPLIDTLFLSPPWGGPAYVRKGKSKKSAKRGSFSLASDMRIFSPNRSTSLDGAALLTAAATQGLAARVVAFLPRHTDVLEAAHALRGEAEGRGDVAVGQVSIQTPWLIERLDNEGKEEILQDADADATFNATSGVVSALTLVLDGYPLGLLMVRENEAAAAGSGGF